MNVGGGLQVLTKPTPILIPILFPVRRLRRPKPSPPPPSSPPPPKKQTPTPMLMGASVGWLLLGFVITCDRFCKRCLVVPVVPRGAD
ncbi:hypothetical protein HanXRQr2_Chr15g0680241 [Helianthus annuus]|uniref:Transmembrane protein n=1 Tax=Helianthus annuus TaxID=4232 RepID=A0A9K3DZH9_HELAN|nr:hypothetical protein HanXRQr2_Chr15g0680241 [Helianthus annuus]KAJ0472098.1 hypothetical protein HanHA89_Chr15g0603191 [Helianthus annuus]